MSTGLRISKRPNETWREAVERLAGGLSEECLACFDRSIAEGELEPGAAWGALYEWDVGLEVYDDEATPAPGKDLEAK